MKITTQKRKRNFFSYMKEHWAGYAMVAPLMVGILVFCYYPPIYGALLAFTDTTGTGGLGKFVWFDNFTVLLKDPIFLESWWTMAKIQIPRLISGIVTPLIFAEIVFAIKGNKAQSIYRILILLPTVAPGVVTTLLWKEIYQPDGLLNTILYHLGIRSAYGINWLGDERFVIPAILIQGFPWIGGSQVLIYVSGLMNIPREVLEAAELDGASEWQKIFKIHIFHISGQIRYFLIFGIINGFQDYGTQVVLTKGGPGFSTYVPGYYMYQLISTGGSGEYGKASAIGVILFAIIMVLTFVCNKFVKFGDSKED